MLDETGNEDLCFYNFWCAHPLGPLSDFNHVFSNIGYILFGVLFIAVCARRNHHHNQAVKVDYKIDKVEWRVDEGFYFWQIKITKFCTQCSRIDWLSKCV